jgi:hypothetical protein
MSLNLAEFEFNVSAVEFQNSGKIVRKAYI